jgi:hypothetical protein
MRIGRVVGRDVAVEDVGKNQRRWAVSCMRTESGSARTGTARNRTSKETREGQRQAEVGVRLVVLPTMTVSTLAWISAQLPPRAAEHILACAGVVVQQKSSKSRCTIGEGAKKVGISQRFCGRCGRTERD